MAQSPSDADRRAATARADEMLRCSVYFRITAGCLEGGPDTRVPDAIKDLNDSAARSGALAAATGAAAGVTAAVQRARAEALHEEMMASLHHTCHDIAILLRDHHNFCLRLLGSAGRPQAELSRQEGGTSRGN